MARRAPISRLRGSGSFRRNPGRKLPRSITLIVCEGETEQKYFGAARIRCGLSTTEVVLADNTEGAAPISVVGCAEKRCAEQGGYDRVFCVFDRDGHESFHRACERIRALSGRKRKPLPIKEAISIPCFEVWVLLHFEKKDAPFSRCSDVIDRVREYMPDYEKANANIARRLVEVSDIAINHAEWLEGRAEGNDFNPFTNVHRVLQHFASVVAEGGSR